MFLDQRSFQQKRFDFGFRQDVFDFVDVTDQHPGFRRVVFAIQEIAADSRSHIFGFPDLNDFIGQFLHKINSRLGRKFFDLFFHFFESSLRNRNRHGLVISWRSGRFNLWKKRDYLVDGVGAAPAFGAAGAAAAGVGAAPAFGADELRFLFDSCQKSV